MKLGKSTVVRIVKRQNYAPTPEKRMTEDSSQGDSLLNVKKTVLSWIDEFENKGIVELRREFSNLFGVKGRDHHSLKLSRQLVVKKKCPNDMQGTQVREEVKIATRYLDKTI